MENGDEALDDVLEEDLDIFDLALAYTDDGTDVRIAAMPVKLTRNEIFDAQRRGDFCQTVLTRQSRETTQHSTKTNTDYCADGTLRLTRLTRFCCPKRYEHVYAISRTIRSSPATPDRHGCTTT